MITMATLVPMMQYLTLEKDADIRAIANLVKTLSPIGFHNPRISRQGRYRAVSVVAESLANETVTSATEKKGEVGRDQHETGSGGRDPPAECSSHPKIFWV